MYTINRTALLFSRASPSFSWVQRASHRYVQATVSGCDECFYIENSKIVEAVNDAVKPVFAPKQRLNYHFVFLLLSRGIKISKRKTKVIKMLPDTS